MASVVVCPRCTSSLELSVEADPGAQVQCPVCEVEFSLATVIPRELPQARVIERVVDAPEERAGAETIEEFSSEFMQPTVDWQPPHPMRASLAEFNVEIADHVPSEPEDATATAPADPPEIQLGASRLDQLLSELIKGSAAAKLPPVVEAPSMEFEPAVAEEEAEEEQLEPDYAQQVDEDPLANDFDTELEGEAPPEEEEHLIGHAGTAIPDMDHADVELRAAPRRKRRSSPVRMLVGIVGGGAMGLFLGAYALLWLRGADGDIAGLAKWLPHGLLPKAARSVVDNDEPDHAGRRAELAPAKSESGDPTSQKPTELVANNQARFDPAVVPATATEPVQPANSPAPPTDPPKAVAPPTVVSDLRDIQLNTLDDLSDALVAAKTAQQRLLSGDLARPETRAEMGQAYIELCRLAERFTLIDPAAAGTDLEKKRAEATEVFRAVASDPSHRPSLALLAARWLQWEQRKNQGIVVVGRVREFRQQGHWTQCVLEIPLEPTAETATVLMDPATLAIGQNLAVVGVIVANPKEHFAGYDGEAPQIIVAAHTFASEPVKP